MRILLTGATGFIGTNFILKLHQKYEITALVRDSSNIEKIKHYSKIYRYDRDFKNLLLFFQKEKFDGIVHLATFWVSQHTSQDLTPLIDNNITFGLEILEASKQAEIPFFINTSSFGIYCNSKTYRPSSLYAATKKAFEDIIAYYALTSKTIFSHLLIYNAYGEHDKANRLFSLLYQHSISQEPLAMSDGTQIIDISYIDDIIFGFDCLLQALQETPSFCQNKIFSLKNQKRYTLREIVRIFEEVCGKKLNIQWGKREKRELEIELPWQGGERLPNWVAKIELKEGIQKWIDAIKM